MPGIARLNSMCTGHDCHPPRINDTASPNVFVEGLGVHRQSDHWTTHCCDDSCHDSILASGSGSVYINGLQCGRIGDPIACGSMIMTGAETCFSG